MGVCKSGLAYFTIGAVARQAGPARRANQGAGGDPAARSGWRATCDKSSWRPPDQLAAARRPNAAAEHHGAGERGTLEAEKGAIGAAMRGEAAGCLAEAYWGWWISYLRCSDTRHCM